MTHAMMGRMKQLTDHDIEQMGNTEFIPDVRATVRSVRRHLRLGQLIPTPPAAAPRFARLDLHHNTQEQAWQKINQLADSGVRDAQIITGASGILKIKFQQWVTASTLADKIISWAPVNNGSFVVKFKRRAGN